MKSYWIEAIVDNKGILMMDSGNGKTMGNPELNIHEYSGANLTDIIYYYENVALPKLEAVGEADTGKYEDGWYLCAAFPAIPRAKYPQHFAV